MHLTVVITFFNGYPYLDRLLSSIPNYQPVLIVDDHSDEPLDPNLTNKKYDNVWVIRPEQKGYFAGAVNAGIEATTGDILALNQDIWFENGAFESILARLASLPAGVAIAGDGVMSHPAWPKGYVQGTLMYLRREAIDQVGPLNAVDFPLWGGTAEWQARACRRGWRADPWPEIPGFKHERPQGVTFGSAIKTILERQPEQKTRLVRTPPLVSVIIPSYNHGQFLTDAVHSLIGGPSSFGMLPPQTFQAFEVIIVDDASTDNTQEVGQALADPWKGIHYLRLAKNAGTPAANNAGIRASYGKYLTILCADDLRESGSLDRLFRAQAANPHSIIYDDVIFRLTKSGREKVWVLPEYNFDRLVERNYIDAGIMFPRKGWEEIGGYPEAMRHGREDWAVNVAFGAKGYCGVRVPVPGYIYRRHDHNRTLSNSNPEWRETFVSQMKALFPDIYAGRRPMGCCGNRPNFQPPAPPAIQASLVGAGGMVALEYQGHNYGSETYYGAATGQHYIFSADHRVSYVDQRDARQLLGLYEINQPVFRLYEPPKVIEEPVREIVHEPVREIVHEPVREAVQVKPARRKKRDGSPKA